MRLFADVTSQVTDPFLARAASLAESARGATAPNPLVGCVIARDGVVVGEGFHHRAGEPHAEVLALQAAGEAALGADAYVTLEPCAHTGKTPPCAEALIAAGIARVVIGMHDPNPEAGGGAAKLQAAGIVVDFADDPAPFEELNAGWLHRIRVGRPLVTVKLGLSLDARLAFASGKRASITGPGGSVVTQRLRAASDAVLVSAATVIADDPALTVRDVAGRLADRQPLRVILVRDHVPQAEARVFNDEAAPTLVLAVGSKEGTCEFIPASVDVHQCTGSPLADAFVALAERGVGELLVEPGPRLFSALWTAGLVDRLVVVTAGGVAGDAGPALFIGEAQRDGDALVRRMAPVEAGIVEDVSVTVWQPFPAVGEE